MKLIVLNGGGIKLYKITILIKDKQQYLSNIYDSYAESIYRFLLVKTSSPETAQDLTSETFLRFVGKIMNEMEHSLALGETTSSPYSIENERAFLYKTARNLVIDYYRQKGRTVVLGEDIQDIDKHARNNQSINTTQEAIKQFDLEKDIMSLTKSLVKIQDIHAEVIILRYVEEMSFLEISEIIEKPEGTVRVMLHRGMKELREIASTD